MNSGWSIRQLDIKNAFIHGSLFKEIYMVQPSSFIDPTHPNHIFKLHKAIYGLKQAPPAWFQEISSFFLAYGFIQSQADSSMFVYRKRLAQEFEIKDLGPLYYFLGVEVVRHPDHLLLSQTRYTCLIAPSSLSVFKCRLRQNEAHDELYAVVPTISVLVFICAFEFRDPLSRVLFNLEGRYDTLDLLCRSNMIDCKPCTTPISARMHMSAFDGASLSDPSEYHRLVSALQYLTLTWLEISFAVNHAAQFMSHPQEPHLAAVKSILRYLKWSFGHGISFQYSPGAIHLIAFSDADWAGCPDNR
ncbi:uncharacterized mitochondrial protein AtMg00810-like [Cornus florida]|uniref:uncharacterized mitochondrial protein AtMg00810-like n=1 Tax=Cornus florida TaxID=4283 RepID=UPI00289D7D3A|nr:uncharacterized mitochondrial protein AtMg00810-like [Cornus florida]